MCATQSCASLSCHKQNGNGNSLPTPINLPYKPVGVGTRKWGSITLNTMSTFRGQVLICSQHKSLKSMLLILWQKINRVFTTRTPLRHFLHRVYDVTPQLCSSHVVIRPPLPVVGHLPPLVWTPHSHTRSEFTLESGVRMRLGSKPFVKRYLPLPLVLSMCHEMGCVYHVLWVYRRFHTVIIIRGA